MTVFFVGAGASWGTLRRARCCPPIATRFGSSLSNVMPGWRHRYPGLRQVVDHIGLPLSAIGLERLWTCIDYYAKLQVALPRARWSKSNRLVHDLKRALLRLFGSACDEIAELLPISSYYTLGELLKHQMRPGDVLVSFNYDTLIERLALRFGHDVRLARRPRAGIVQLVKPHGSVAWQMDWRLRRIRTTASGGRPLTESMNERDVSRDLEPLLLGAVPIKSELIREVQRCYLPDVFTVVASQWKAVTEAIRQTDRLVIVGYGFPSEDQYGRFLLAEAMHSRRKPSLPRVEFFELAKNKKRTSLAIREAFRESKLSPIYRGKVTMAALKRRRAG